MPTSELDRLHHPLRLTRRRPVRIHLRARHVIQKHPQHITRGLRDHAELLIDDHDTSIEQRFDNGKGDVRTDRPIRGIR